MIRKKRNYSEASIKRRADFATAIKAAALIRKTFLPSTKELWDETCFNRLRKLAIEIINTGPATRKGNLQFTDGDISNLIIDFNSIRPLQELFSLVPLIRFENTKYLIVRFPKMVMQEQFKHPENATSVIVRIVCGIFHFELGKAGKASSRDLEIPLGNHIFPGGSLKFPLQSAENSVISVAMCIWYKSGNTKITNPHWYAGKIVQSFNIVNGEIRHFEPDIQADSSTSEEKNDNEIAWELDDE